MIGVPDAEMGEQVKAVVQLKNGFEPSDELGQEIIGYVRERLAYFKAPRSVDFVEELPRTETGKLLKRELQHAYRPAPEHRATFGAPPTLSRFVERDGVGKRSILTAAGTRRRPDLDPVIVEPAGRRTMRIGQLFANSVEPLPDEIVEPELRRIPIGTSQ